MTQAVQTDYKSNVKDSMSTFWPEWGLSFHSMILKKVCMPYLCNVYDAITHEALLQFWLGHFFYFGAAVQGLQGDLVNLKFKVSTIVKLAD